MDASISSELFKFITTSLSEQSKHIILAATKISIQETDDREGMRNNVDLSVNASRSRLLLPVDKLALQVQDDTEHAEAVLDISQEHFFLIRKICAGAAHSIEDPPSHVSEIVMQQIVGVSVSMQLNDEIVLIRRVYEERRPDKCADVPALLIRCAGMERLTYVGVPGSIKSRPNVSVARVQNNIWTYQRSFDWRWGVE